VSQVRTFRRKRQKKLEKWMKSADSRIRMLLVDMTRAGIAAEGFDVIGRNIILTVRYDPELHTRCKHNDDEIPADMHLHEKQRWWIIGTLCNLFKARLTAKELPYLHELYLVILNPDGGAREVMTGSIARMVQFAGDHADAEDFVKHWRMKAIDQSKEGLQEVLRYGRDGSIEINH